MEMKGKFKIDLQLIDNKTYYSLNKNYIADKQFIT